ncbi:MAG: tRNA-(ms[2]io[6]A)-hydroxylase [Saprospiraceae bacterium]|nr:tRNA-(ms[2]io[6]A)-hydroxylase [Saprospiraceae bacterium]MBK8451591.1 tRNA-(ms[2]io[6]A)-hydroxylase [Saprospiraceae bacterium]MBK8486025.1 tRNA-(ms[2]io[6]A)-hydroxylase [Saprospiraceae bacterium]MBK9221067.1 tRNA-(ms[2]io[6]A)-hydroxylase [Saprospiraceae bacterium]MBK9722081.1 tRNA-(ms[2]io[6]A)-hydroxylase [Saprospiraceae bacterium]
MPSGKEITKLGLHLPTDPRWVNLASISLQDILTDHAYCEQKAASSGISLIQKYPDKIELVEAVSPVVTEEWGHFRLVITELKKRNLKLGFQRKDEYVNQLLKFQKQGGSREDRLIEYLLTFALIEARSCERFRLLSLQLEEDGLKKFYHHFMVSEAGHYKMFLDLAEFYSSKIIMRSRWQEYLDYEALIIKSLEPRGDRMH